MSTERPLSFGEKACGLAFNPDGNEMVYAIKSKYAELIDVLDAARTTNADGEVKRMLSIAITEAQTSQMWAVKAVTWK